MILIRYNVEKHTDDARMIEALKADGYVEYAPAVKAEVKADDTKPKRKRTRKTAKADSK